MPLHPLATTDHAGAGDESDAEATLDAAGQALFWLGRSIGRQPPRQLLAGSTGAAAELGHILAVQAVEAAGAARPGDEVTVGTVAARLDLDPSTASRLVAAALRAGYLTRAAAPGDARRAALALSDQGRELAASARRHQRAVFEEATRDWSATERRDFARHFVRFAAAIVASRAGR